MYKNLFKYNINLTIIIYFIIESDCIHLGSRNQKFYYISFLKCWIWKSISVFVPKPIAIHFSLELNFVTHKKNPVWMIYSSFERTSYQFFEKIANELLSYHNAFSILSETGRRRRVLFIKIYSVGSFNFYCKCIFF